ncbi:hypothetical protein QZM42_33240 [Burkholderia vietnamiensis]|uniref:hypothetical protein n=1 Tax=Burkholderia vietnamiensis TaxID=60552 RepID=UPI0015899EC2|nr:hypothetical protein [Burkholderia vietnamiensis]MDN7413394.1 hypothetical protein [Burkholderia vietnamiensis]
MFQTIGGITMHFALLLSQLPHVEEARTHYNGMLTLDCRPHASARVVAVIRTALRKLAR